MKPTNFTKKALKETEWRSLLTLIVLVLFSIVMLIISIIGNYGWIALSQSEQKRDQLIIKIDQLEQQTKQLNQQIHNLKFNSSYIKMFAKKNLGFTSPKEEVYFLSSRKAKSN